jgi:hypothetical protein
VQYEIPCETRVGGPVQPITGADLLSNIPARHNAARMGRNKEQYANFWFTAPTGGVKGYTATFQMGTAPTGGNPDVNGVPDTGATWFDLPPKANFDKPPTYLSVQGRLIQYILVGNQLTVDSTTGTSDWEIECTMRVLIQSSAGVSSTNWARFRAMDTDGCGFIHGPDTNGKTSYEFIPGSPPIA